MFNCRRISSFAILLKILHVRSKYFSTILNVKEKIANLRSATSLPLSQCKQALVDANGDEQNALSLLLNLTGSSGKLNQIMKGSTSVNIPMLSAVMKGDGLSSLYILQLSFDSDFGARSESSQATIVSILSLLENKNTCLDSGADPSAKNVFEGINPSCLNSKNSPNACEKQISLKDKINNFDEINSLVSTLSRQLRENVSISSIFKLPLHQHSIIGVYIHPPFQLKGNSSIIAMGEKIVSIVEFCTTTNSISADKLHRKTIQDSSVSNETSEVCAIEDNSKFDIERSSIIKRIAQQFATEGRLVDQPSSISALNKRPFLFAPTSTLGSVLEHHNLQIKRAFRLDGEDDGSLLCLE